MARADTAEPRAGAGATMTAPPGVPPTVEVDPDRRSYYLELFLVSLAGILLEISYTRAVSFKLYYYYTYLVIGLALLGIGFGGVLVTISPRLRRVATASLMMWSLVIGAVTIGVGYLVIAAIPVDTFAIWNYQSFDSVKNLALLLTICLGLFVPYVAIGVIISTLFGRHPDRIGRLYFADLIGAGLACAIVVLLLGQIGPVSTIFLAALLLAGCGLRLAIRSRSRVIAVRGHPHRGAGRRGRGAVGASRHPPRRQQAPRLPRRDTIYSKWSPIFRGRRRPGVARCPGAVPRRPDRLRDLPLGRRATSPWATSTSTPTSGRCRSRRSAPPPEREMIIGAAGGYEVLSSLYYDAGHIDAIELNPVTYNLVTDDFADYSGHIAEHPKVNYVNGDGRSYLARSDDDYNLVWYPAPDSYAATNAANAGAFVLSESYLYTSDAIKESLEHLAPGGLVATQFGERDFDNKPNRTTRYVATAREALGELGVRRPEPSHHRRHLAHHPGRHVGVDDPREAHAVHRRRDRAVHHHARRDRGTRSCATPRATPENNSVSTVATSSSAELDEFFDSYPYDVQSDQRQRAVLLALPPVRRRGLEHHPLHRGVRLGRHRRRARARAAPHHRRDHGRGLPVAPLRRHPPRLVGAPPQAASRSCTSRRSVSASCSSRSR